MSSTKDSMFSLDKGVANNKPAVSVDMEISQPLPLPSTSVEAAARASSEAKFFQSTQPPHPMSPPQSMSDDFPLPTIETLPAIEQPASRVSVSASMASSSAARISASASASSSVPKASLVSSGPATSSSSVSEIFGSIWNILNETNKLLEQPAKPAMQPATQPSALQPSQPTLPAQPVQPSKIDSVAESSRKFNSLNEMNYSEKMLDGFHVVYEGDKEVVVIDSSFEPKLKALIATTHSFLKIFRTAEKRSLALAKLCVQRFGGGSAVIENVDRYKAYFASERVKQANLNNWNPGSPALKELAKKYPGMVVISLGNLIEVAGLDRHCGLLYKYLADRTGILNTLAPRVAATATANTKQDAAVKESHENQNNGGKSGIQKSDIQIDCRLTRRWISDTIRTDVAVKIDGSDSDWVVDLFSNPPRLIREDTLARHYSEVPRSGISYNPYTPVPPALRHQPSRPAQKAARISFHSLLTARVDVTPTEFASIWNSARVTVKFSPLAIPTAKPTYDIERFTKEMDILATSLHPSLIRTRAICLPPEASNSSLNIPAIAIVRDPLEAQPLVDALDPPQDGEKGEKRRKRWTFERMLNVGLQLSEAMSELHLFGMVHGELTPRNLLITPIGDIKVGDFDAKRYSLDPLPAKIAMPYRAPELVAKDYQDALSTDGQAELMLCYPKPTVKSDVYSFGCVLLAVATGQEPWKGIAEDKIRNAIVERRQTPVIPTDLTMDARLTDVIKRCTAYAAADRPTFEEVASILKSILDASKTVVPVTQTAPFGWGNLRDTNFGASSGALSNGNSLVDSRDIVRLRQKLQPMSDDAVTVAREKFCSTLGTIDPYMIVAKRVDAPSFYVVHRPPMLDPVTNKTRNRVAIVTCGLWDPNELPTAPVSSSSSSTDNPSQSGGSLPGMELMAEAWEDELGDMSSSWLYQCLLEVACTAKRNGTKLRRLLRERSFATMEVMDIKLPFEFLDPTTGRACMMLGIESPTVPKYFMAPGNTPVSVITARLLTLAEWRDSQEFAVGKKPLAARFFREGTHHYSTLVLPKPTVSASASAIADPSAAVSKPTVNGTKVPEATPAATASHGTKRPNESIETPAAKFPNNNGTRLSKESGPIPAAAWTVTKLKQRLEQAKKIDADKASQPVVRTPAPNALGTTALTATATSTAATPPTGAPLQRYSVPNDTAATAANVVTPTPYRVDGLEPFEVLGDVSDYEPPVPTGVIVNSPCYNNRSDALAGITAAIRQILSAKSTSSERLKTAAQTIYGALGTQSQLYGWQHVSEYIRNPQLYIERTKTAQRGGSSANATAQPVAPLPVTARGPSELHEHIDTLQETGHAVVKRLVQRLEWLLNIFARENVPVDAETLITLIGTDKKWMDDATAFMNSCEYKVAELLSKNPQRFNQFRDLQKKGVQWPHSLDLRRMIERAGFTFRPMMIKRDRTVCDTCGAEVSGHRPWYDIRTFHDYSKHAVQYKMEKLSTPLEPNGCSINPIPMTLDPALSAVVANPEQAKRMDNLQQAQASALSAATAIAASTQLLMSSSSSSSVGAATVAAATQPSMSSSSSSAVVVPTAPPLASAAKTSPQQYARYYRRNGTEIQPDETLLGNYIKSVNVALMYPDDKICYTSFLNYMNSCKPESNALMSVMFPHLVKLKGLELRKYIAGLQVGFIGGFFPDIARVEVCYKGDGKFVKLEDSLTPEPLVPPMSFMSMPQPSAPSLAQMASSATSLTPSMATLTVKSATPTAATPSSTLRLSMPHSIELDPTLPTIVVRQSSDNENGLRPNNLTK